MKVHFLHIAKTGGTAIRYAVKEYEKNVGELLTPYGVLRHHRHKFKLRDVRPGHHAVVTVRDPASRFVSSFYSRLNAGGPRYPNQKWSPEEEKAFKWFQTPQELALALGQKRGRAHRHAEFAMGGIRHVRGPQSKWLGTAEEFRTRLSQVLYIARQETLNEDWERLKKLLALPKDLNLPTDPVKAHSVRGDEDRTLTDEMKSILREWFAEDYRLLEVCEAARQEMIARVDELPLAPHPAN